MEGKILGDRDLRIGELMTLFKEKSKDLRLSQTHKMRYNEFFTQVIFRQKYLRDMEGERRPDGADSFFEYLFERRPVGKIKVVRGKLSFVIICEDAEDYEKAFLLKNGGIDESYGKTLWIKDIPISLINAGGIYRGEYTKSWQDVLDYVIEHEERHFFQDMIEDLKKR